MVKTGYNRRAKENMARSRESKRNKDYVFGSKYKCVTSATIRKLVFSESMINLREISLLTEASPFTLRNVSEKHGSDNITDYFLGLRRTGNET